MDLIDAVKKNNINTVKRLLQNGVNPNQADDKDNITPLHFAATYNAVDVIPLLISAGANLDAKTCDGLTPLDCAHGLKNANTANILIKN